MSIDTGALEQIIQTAADASVQRSLYEMNTVMPRIRHGTVTLVDVINYIHWVQMDGDDDSIQVHDAMVFGPPVGARVTVLHSPPHQGIIIGLNQDLWHEVGTAGNPEFGGGWTNDSTSGPLDTDEYPLTSFRRFGHWVEVRGNPIRTSGISDLIFVLPPWYVPRNNLAFAVIGPLGGPVIMQIDRNGNVRSPSGAGPLVFEVSYSVS